MLRDAACDPIGSMIAAVVPLENLRELSERVRPPLVATGFSQFSATKLVESTDTGMTG